MCTFGNKKKTQLFAIVVLDDILNFYSFEPGVKKNGGTTNLIFQLISLEFGVFVVKIFNNHCTKMQINRVVRADFTSIKIRGRSFRCMQISSTK